MRNSRFETRKLPVHVVSAYQHPTGLFLEYSQRQRSVDDNCVTSNGWQLPFENGGQPLFGSRVFCGAVTNKDAEHAHFGMTQLTAWRRERGPDADRPTGCS